MKWTMVVTALLAVAAISCANGGNTDTSNALLSQQCSWPSSLNGADGRSACQPARALVACTDATGAGCGCLSDQISCSSCQLADVTCHDQCAADQYAVACGGVGPGPVPSPPDGCTFATANPGGVAYYCCPCQ